MSDPDKIVAIPFNIIDEIIPALLGALLVYKKLEGQPGFEYLTQEDVAAFEQTLDRLIALCVEAGFEFPSIDPEE